MPQTKEDAIEGRPRWGRIIVAQNRDRALPRFAVRPVSGFTPNMKQSVSSVSVRGDVVIDAAAQCRTPQSVAVAVSAVRRTNQPHRGGLRPMPRIPTREHWMTAESG